MVWMDHSFFLIHLLADEYIGYFQLLAITSKAAVNIHVHVFV